MTSRWDNFQNLKKKRKKKSKIPPVLSYPELPMAVKEEMGVDKIEQDDRGGRNQSRSSRPTALRVAFIFHLFPRAFFPRIC